jgi:hypothetical protein
LDLFENVSIDINKSNYILGLQCEKAIWLDIHQYERGAIEMAPEFTQTQRKEIKAIAQTLVPHGVLIPTVEADRDESIQLTEIALRNEHVIYDACFEFNNTLVVADILYKTKAGWHLYNISYSDVMDSVCLEELTFQYYAITECGLPLAQATSLLINKKYVRQGTIDANKFFISYKLTKDVRDSLPILSESVSRMKEIVSDSEPDVSIGYQCSHPYQCPFMYYCWSDVPYDSVLELQGHGINKYDYHRSGILRLDDLSTELLHGKQLLQVEAAQNKKVLLNESVLDSFLSQFWYPRCFINFSDISAAIPPFNGLRPFQPVAISYSIHTQESCDAEIKHTEFLPSSADDSRRNLLEKLLDDISGNCCVVVCDKAHVANIMKGLEISAPELKLKVRNLLNNMVDLMEPFRAWHIYSWRQHGDSSPASIFNAFLNKQYEPSILKAEILNITDMWLDNFSSAVMPSAVSDLFHIENMMAIKRHQDEQINSMRLLLTTIERIIENIEYIADDKQNLNNYRAVPDNRALRLDGWHVNHKQVELNCQNNITLK